jgi:hypothetical protein
MTTLIRRLYAGETQLELALPDGRIIYVRSVGGVAKIAVEAPSDVRIRTSDEDEPPLLSVSPEGVPYLISRWDGDVALAIQCDYAGALVEGAAPRHVGARAYFETWRTLRATFDGEVAP